MGYLYGNCLLKHFHYIFIVFAHKLLQFCHELRDGEFIKFGERHQTLGGHNNVHFLVRLIHGIEFINAHLLDEDGFSTGDAATACETVIQTYSGLLLGDILLHNFGLDAILRWGYVIINLRQLDNTCEHSYKLLIISVLLLLLYIHQMPNLIAK